MSGEQIECAVCGSPLAGGVCAVCLLGVGLEEGADDDPGQVDLVAERPGDVVGRYTLLEKAGEGGFGVVFRAEQKAPIRRVVAVKIIKPGMDTVEVVRRFEAERQALAVMAHPHIAKVYDAGTTPLGRPYFVMEYVEGQPVTEFCDDHRFSLRQRLELFAEICRAVQHAHQKGIIHRDLKPGNILVSKDEHGEVTPKVIDFGVAKAISIELTDKTFFTVFGRMMGTPQYMSPEQTDLNAVDVDTRSDIYSLGVLLYELVTGCVPIEREKLSSATFDEMRRLIREDEPQKPSTRVAALGGAELERVAKMREVDAGKFRRYLLGDLDWVVMKALEKDRTRRYETAQGFANDIANHLADQPVSAGPPGTAYWLRKFAHRHRGPVLAGLVSLLVLLVGSIVLTKGYFLVREEKNKKDHEHLKLLVEGVWNWREAQPGSRTAALEALGTVGAHDLESTGLDKAAAQKLRESARDAMLACMLWTDLHERPVWKGVEVGWAPAALDGRGERGVVGLGKGGLAIRDMKSGEVLAVREGDGTEIGGPLRFDSSGELVAAGFGEVGSWELVIWNWKRDEEPFEVRAGVAEAFDFHPGGEGYVVGEANGEVRFYSREGALLGEVLALGEKPLVLRYAPDGDSLVVALEGGDVLLVESKSREEEGRWRSGPATALAWAPDGSAVVAGRADGVVQVLEVGTGAVFEMEQSHGDRVEQIAWSHDGRLIASGCRDEVRLWDGRQRLLLCDYSAWARSLEFSENDRWLGPIIPDTDEYTIGVLDVDRSEACWAAAGHPGQVIDASTWALEGAVLVTAAGDGVRFWNRQGAELAHKPSYRVSPGGLVGRGEDLYLAEKAENGGVRHLKLSVREKRLVIEEAARWPVVKEGKQMALSPKGDLLAVAQGAEVVLFDLEKGEVRGAPLESLPSTAFLSVSPDGKWLAAGTRGGSGVRLWDISDGVSAPIDLPVEGSAPVAFYPIKHHPVHGELPSMLLTGDSAAYRIWVPHPEHGWVQKSEHENEMANPEGQVATMVFSPRGTVLVACFSRKYLQILHPTELVVKAQPKFDKQWPLTMSPDEGRLLATEAIDGRIFLWNLEVARQELDERGLDWREFGAFETDDVPLIEP